MAVFAFVLLLILAVANMMVPESAVPALGMALCCATVIGKDGARLMRRLVPQAQAQGAMRSLWGNFWSIARAGVALEYSITALERVGSMMAMTAVMSVLAAMGAVVVLCWAKPTKELVRSSATSKTS